ncbi:hypothetical protein ACHWQZ_G006599 [Mnemiopsis leidyi]
MVLEVLALFPRLAPFKVITLDDVWDQWNRSFMFIMTVLFGSIVTIRSYTGSVIECDGFLKVPVEFAKDYCWTQGIYTLREGYDYHSSLLPYPGVFPEDAPGCLDKVLDNGGRVICPMDKKYRKYQRVYHSWYQFTAFYFWTASCAFFLPYMMFKFFGMGDLKPVISMLHNPVETAEELDMLTKKAARWLYVRVHAYIHTDQYYGKRVEKHLLFFSIMLTKSCYLLFSVLLFWLTEKMFHIGSFFSYGVDWAAEEPEPGEDYKTLIQDKLFPKMASCEIKRWGTTGIEEEQGMCVLAANVINQYLFLIFWGGMVVTIIVNVLSVLIALSNLCFIQGAYRNLLATAFLRDEPAYSEIWRKSGTSGRVILQLIAKNVNPKIFEHVLNELVNLLKLAERSGYDSRAEDEDEFCHPDNEMEFEDTL